MRKHKLNTVRTSAGYSQVEQDRLMNYLLENTDFNAGGGGGGGSNISKHTVSNFSGTVWNVPGLDSNIVFVTASGVALTVGVDYTVAFPVITFNYALFNENIQVIW